MHSQICPPQSSYSPGNAAAQFWRPVDTGSGSNRRVLLMPSTATNITAGGGTTMSSPGPTPPTPLSHRHSPAARSAPVSPAPPPQPPTRVGAGTTQPSASYGIMHFPRQPPGGGSASQHDMTSEYQNRGSPYGYNQESQSGMGPRHGSLSRFDGLSSSPSDDFAPPSLPPRRNPPPPPPRSGSGLCTPLSPSQHHQRISPDRSYYPATQVDVGGPIQRVVPPPQRTPTSIPGPATLSSPPEAVSDCVDIEVTNGLLHLLFARFVDTSDNSATGAPDLRRVVAHLVRIAHTEIYIQPPACLQTPSQRCLEASVGPSGGLLEKMEASMYEQNPQSAAISPNTGQTQTGTTYLPGANPMTSTSRASGKRRPSRDIEMASISSSSSSDSASSSEEEEELDEEGRRVGADYNIYEGVGLGGRGQNGSSLPAAATTNSASPSMVQTGPKTSSLTVPGATQTNSTTLLTVAELQVLPQNTTIKCLKASAMQALVNLVSAYQLDPALRRRDLDIAQLLARIQIYTMTQSERVMAARNAVSEGRLSPDDGQRVAPTHVPVPEVAALVRLSFHPNHRQAICDLGGLHALLSLLRWEHAWWQLRGYESSPGARPIPQVHSTTPPTGAGLGTIPLHQIAASTSASNAAEDTVTVGTSGPMTTAETSLALRRYICVALTNLTFGAPANKAFVCRRRSHLEALIAQLEVGSEELKQVAASVLRNLSWHTDARSKAALRRAQGATRLTRAVLSAQREATLRTTLNALWNLSSHSTANRKAVCGVNGALAFLVSTLDAKNPNKDVEIKANSGGVLRNLCPVIINSLEYRAVLRTHNCISILLEQLRTSPSVTVVVNVCEVLGALSATPLREARPSSALLFESATTDQALMIRLGALDILHRLAHSRHRYVVSSSKQALENLERANLFIKNQRVVPYPANTDASSFNPTTITNSPVTSNTSSPGTTSPASPAEQVYRRRMSNRSHLRFGLLSVVLETNDDFEEEDESEGESTDCEDEEEGADEVDSVPEEGHSTECSSKASEAGGEEEADFKLPEYPPTPHEDHNIEPSTEKPPTPPPPPAYAQVSVDEEEQACVYAEEGTPFGPSARASTLDLRSPPKQEIYDNFVPPKSRSMHPYVNVDVQSKSDTPNKIASSRVSSPGFETSSNGGGLLETPLMFSRATSSCLSSVDFGPLPPIESSPESVYSVALEDDGEDPNEAIALGTSPSDLPPELIGDGKPKAKNLEGEEETQIMFAEEGSPLDSNSLSEDQESAVAVATMWSPPEPAVDNNNILQQCIASVMPSAVPVNQPNSVRYDEEDVVVGVTTTEDTIQSFAVEGTPFVFSTKNSSLSDVSITDPEGDGRGCAATSASSEISKSVSPRQSILKGDYACSTEDGSSVNEVEEEEGSVNLLSEVIQSALPKQAGFTAPRTEVVETDSSENVSATGRSKPSGIPTGSKLTVPRIGFGHPVQQRRPQATVAPMPQRNTEERHHMQPIETIKSEEKQSSGGSDADNSSFSSLLSIESVGMETSLLQECISSAMPTPKLPISSSCRGIGSSAKRMNPVQQPVDFSLPPPSATAPITTPVSPHSSQSPSPLAVSEITPNVRQKQDNQYQLRTPQNLTQPREQQLTTPSTTRLRRARHFLAHGSGTADDQPPPISRAPDNQTSSIANHLIRPRKTGISSSGVLRTPRTVSGLDNAVGRVLKAPRPMSGNVSPSNTKSSTSDSTTSHTPTLVLKPFEGDKKATDDECFLLPPPSGSFDADDDSVTLVGDNSPPWRPSPPSTPPPPSRGDTDKSEGSSDDNLLDLDAVMNQSNLSLMSDTSKISMPAKKDLTTPLSIKPPSTGIRQIASPGSSMLRPPNSGLRKHATTGLPMRSRSTTASSSPSSSASASPGVRAQSANPSPALTSSSLPRPSKLRAPAGGVSSSSLPRLTNPSASICKPTTDAPRSLTASSAKCPATQAGSRIDLTTSRRLGTVSTRATPTTARSPVTTGQLQRGISTTQPGRTAVLRRALKSPLTSVITTTTPTVVASVAGTKKVIRTGAGCEALVNDQEKQRQIEEGKAIRGGRKIPSSTVRRPGMSTLSPVQRTVTAPSAKSIMTPPSQPVINRPRSGVTSVRPVPSSLPQSSSVTKPSNSGLKPPGFSNTLPSPARSSIRPPQARIFKPSNTTEPSKPSPTTTTESPSSNSLDQWIVRRELTS
nr:adenomatous polyposis coli protein 2 [Hymenolepis microstoma]